jgi:hypothetical protein
MQKTSKRENKKIQKKRKRKRRPPSCAAVLPVSNLHLASPFSHFHTRDTLLKENI